MHKSNTWQQPEAEKGFTLIELLVALGIVAILVAVAIPQYTLYKARGYDEQMKRDLKNAAIAMESYYADKVVYPTTVGEIVATGFNPTAGVSLTINITSPNTYTLTASNPNGTQASFTYTSSTGLIN